MRKKQRSSPAVTKQDIRKLSVKIDTVSAKIDRNQRALNQVDNVSKKIDDVSKKIDRNQKALDQIDDVARILRVNEQNLKDLGGLKHRLDTLDKIYVSVDKIAGNTQSYRQEQELNAKQLSDHEDRLETVEQHLKIPTPV